MLQVESVDVAEESAGDIPTTAVAERIAAVVAPFLTAAIAAIRIAEAAPVGLCAIALQSMTAPVRVREHRRRLGLRAIVRAHRRRCHPHFRRCT